MQGAWDPAYAGKKQIEIAQAIGSSQATISKELSRNRDERGYRPAQADRLARERKSEKGTRPKVMVGMLQDEVEAGSVAGGAYYLFGEN
jgi:IS30 family transposase